MWVHCILALLRTPTMADSLLTFPCRFPIKIMGRMEEGFAQTVLDIVKRHAPDYRGETMEMRSSRAGRYLSVTCTVDAASREQLDGLYRELSTHPSIVMVL
jgi:putative lipoic acid-binding regulatory protein